MLPIQHLNYIQAKSPSYIPSTSKYVLSLLFPSESPYNSPTQTTSLNPQFDTIIWTICDTNNTSIKVSYLQ